MLLRQYRHLCMHSHNNINNKNVMWKESENNGTRGRSDFFGSACGTSSLKIDLFYYHYYYHEMTNGTVIPFICTLVLPFQQVVSTVSEFFALWHRDALLRPVHSRAKTPLTEIPTLLKKRATMVVASDETSTGFPLKVSRASRSRSEPPAFSALTL